MSRGSLWSLFGGRETAGASAVTIHNLTYQVRFLLISSLADQSGGIDEVW